MRVPFVTDRDVVVAGRRFAVRPTTVVAGLILATHVILAVDGARRQWVTYDEVAHLPAGINYWQKRSFFIYHHNPPLTRMLAALPVLAMNPRMEYSIDYRYIPGLRPEWEFGQRFLRLNRDRYLDLFIAARMVTILCSCVTAGFIFLWSRELFGPAAGLVSLATWCFSPAVLAHAQLVTPDVGASAAGVASAYMFRRFLQNPSWHNAAVGGLILGIAELTKFTLLALYPAFVVVALVRGFRGAAEPSPEHDPNVRGVSPWPIATIAALGMLAIFLGQGTLVLPAYASIAVVWGLCRLPGDESPLGIRPISFLRRGLAIGAFSLFVINLGYGFEGSFDRLGDLSFQCRLLTVPTQEGEPQGRVNRFQHIWASEIPVPLPRHFVTGLDSQKLDNDVGFINYLNGEFRQRGWAYYYPLAIAIRTPLGTLFLCLLALVSALANPRHRRSLIEELVLASPAVWVFGLIASQDGLQYSRYLLPCLPFVCVSLGRVAVPGLFGVHWLRGALIVAALGWNLVSILCCHPHELSYFNETMGGPSQGHRYLLETSDWGQDLTFLKDWLSRHPEAGRIRLAYAGNTDPAVLGIAYTLPPMAGTAPGGDQTTHTTKDDEAVYCAVSTHILHGFDWTVFDGQGKAVQLPWNAYRYFLAKKPIDRAGYSILIYRLSARELRELAKEGGSQP